MSKPWKRLLSARAPESGADAGTRGYHVEILLITFAALLLEISYTRIISFKLYYYYTYLVIGLALLGLGAGAVAVAVSPRIRSITTDRVIRLGLFTGAASAAVGYLIVAWLPIRTMAIWNYGTGESTTNIVKLLVLCFVLFASFVAIGVMIATLFARRSEDIGRLYFFDLVGAGLACAIVVPLISRLGPPTIVLLAAAVLAVAGLHLTLPDLPRAATVAVSAVVVVAVAAGGPSVLPDVRVDDDKADLADTDATRWSPVFRVDGANFFDTRRILYHDGLAGSVILEWDGQVESLADLNFDEDARSIPFDTLGTTPGRVMIIGAAGGHEVLVSLDRGVPEIDAVELNPATHDLVTGEYADFSGRFFEQPAVNYVTADGRSYLEQSEGDYDLVWYPAPDSYAASSVAASGAFVLSESYLYTSETIEETLDHLSENGILAAQFGELNYDVRSNRTIRYAGTVRSALEAMGVDDVSGHVLVASTGDANFPNLRYSTVLVKATPFTNEEILRFADTADKPNTRIEYLPGVASDNPVTAVLTLPGNELDDWYSDYRYDVSPIDDNAPFFWHFARFSDVMREMTEPIHPSFVDPEDAVGERVLLLLLTIAVLFAAVFLLLPFLLIRDVWSALPSKGVSSVYFGALGLGFMFFEITMIQKLVLFLGYPTYSLTVTLASLLIFSGVGALLSNRLTSVDDGTRRLLPALIAITAAYLIVMPRVTDGLLTAPLAIRVVATFVFMAPLGICLGMFMPLGVRSVAALSPHATEYVAWGWAVNGFASVIGSVLTTIVAMIFGFNVVLILGLVVYLVAIGTLRVITRRADAATAAPGPADEITTADLGVTV